MSTSTTEPLWTLTESGTGHEVSLLDGKVVCRDSAGKVLKSVPAKLKDDPAVVAVKQLREWLDRHDSECAETVSTWMIRSLPVPVSVITAVWPDPSWRAALQDMVVVADGEQGFLRDADPDRGIGVVTLDGDTVYISVATVEIPHPVLLSDLDDLREFSAELGVQQGVEQLFRQVWTRPSTVGKDDVAYYEYADGSFKELRHLTGRARGNGFTVQGGYSVVVAWEHGVRTEARVWIGEGDPESPTDTGPLGWVDAESKAVPLGQVGPVAWSEGVRMAAILYAGRVVDEEVEQ